MPEESPDEFEPIKLKAKNDSDQALDKTIRTHDHSDPVPFSTTLATDNALPGEHINQTFRALHVNNHALHGVRAASVSEVEAEHDFEDRSDKTVRQ